MKLKGGPDMKKTKHLVTYHLDSVNITLFRKTVNDDLN